jgi:hypothetical protein
LSGSWPRRTNRTLLPSITTAPTPMIGASGYSRRKELLLQTAFAVENPSQI